MGTHNICLYKEDKRYTGHNLKIRELLDCVLTGVFAVSRVNMVFVDNSEIVFFQFSIKKNICCGYSLGEVLLMSTHNICFYDEIRKSIQK